MLSVERLMEQFPKPKKKRSFLSFLDGKHKFDYLQWCNVNTSSHLAGETIELLYVCLLHGGRLNGLIAENGDDIKPPIPVKMKRILN